MAQPAHMDIDEVGIGDKSVVPDVLEKHRACHHLALAAHHIFEQPTFQREQLDLATGPMRRPVDQVEFERTDPQFGLACLGRTAQQGLDPRGDFNERERLGKIVIAKQG
jgi:hypothetical protein